MYIDTTYRPTDRSIYLSIYLSTCKLENKAILRDFLSFLNLTTSKTQQFSETSSIFALDNIKNETILPDILNFCTWQHQKQNNSARLPHFSKLTTSKTKQFVHLSKVLRLPRKSDARSYMIIRSAAPVTQNHLSKPEDLMLQNATPLKKSRPDLLTALMNMSLVLRHRFWKCYKTLTFCSLLTRCTIPCACHAKRHLNIQKWREHVVFFTF